MFLMNPAFGKVSPSTAFSHSKGKRSVSFNLSGKLKFRICWPVHFLIVLVFLTQVSGANAQNYTAYWNSIFPYSGYPSKVSFSDVNTGYGISGIVDEPNTRVIKKTTDGGRTWKTTGMASQLGTDLWDSWPITAFTTSLVYVGPFKTINGGELWYNVFPGASAVAFYDENNGFAAKGNEVFKTTNGGDTWTKVSSLAFSNITSISYRNASSKLCLTSGSSNFVALSDNSGLTFSYGSSPGNELFSFGQNQYFEMKWFDANRGIFCRGSYLSGVGGVMYRTIDGGQNWTRTFIGGCNLNSLNPRLHLFSSGIGYVSGITQGSGCSTIGTFKTSDYGANWTNITNGGERVDLGYAFSVSQLQAFQYNRPVQSSNGGTTWSAITTEPLATPGAIVYDFQMLSDNVWVALFNQTNSGTTSWYAQRTSDAGTSWTDMDPVVTGLGSIASGGPSPFRYVFKGFNGYKISSTTPTSFFYTSDGGANWSSVSTSPSAAVTANRLVMPRINRFLFAGNKVVTRTGSTASVENMVFSGAPSDNPDPVLSFIDFADEDNGFGVSKDDLFRTTNGGKNWTLVTSNFPAHSDRMEVMKLKDINTMYFSMDDGTPGSGPNNGAPKKDLFRVDLSSPTIMATIVIPGLPSALENARILDFDLEGDNGILLTSDGTILETGDAWTNTLQIQNGDGLGFTFLNYGIINISSNTSNLVYTLNDKFMNAGDKSLRRYADNDVDTYGGTEFYYKRPGPPLAFPFSINYETLTDCNDKNNAIKPGAPDIVCNGIDDNCNGLIDEEATFVEYYQDSDGDGFGNPSQVQSLCSGDPGSGWVTNNQDCDDFNPGLTLATNWYLDVDGDGYGTQSIEPGNIVSSCIDPSIPGFAQYVRNNRDCNDADPLEYNSVWFLDSDQDGFGTSIVDATLIPPTYVFSCSNPSTDVVKYVRNGRDCNDADPLINPGRFENNSDGIDNDCDGLGDEGSDPPGTTYCDLDGDGFGDPGCPIPPAGMMASKGGTQVFVSSSDGVENNTDCDDTNPRINPLAFEFSDDKDNDCNGIVNDTIPAAGSSWYQDADGDGFGNLSVSQTSSTQPTGYVANSSDCDDNNAAINPAATEICGNGLDDNCDGSIDNGGPALPATGPISGAALVCKSSSGNVYSIDPVNGASAYTWTLPTGATGTSTSNSNSISVSFSSTFTSGSICVTPAGSCGIGTLRCLALSSVTVKPGTPAAISGNATGICTTATQTYSVAAVSGASSYNWTAPANTSILSGQGSNQIVLQFASNFTSGSLSVTASNCAGTSAARSLSLSRKAIPGTPGVISGTNGFCVPSTQTYSIAAVANASEYTWTAPNNASIVSQTGTSVTVEFSAAYITGTLSVKASNCNGTSAARNLAISRKAVPGTPGLISGTINFCLPATVTYGIVPVTNASEYTWTPPANATIVSQTGTSITLSFGTSYTGGSLSVTAGNCSGTSPARLLTVNPKAIPGTPGVISGQTSGICPYQTKTYSIPALANAESYQWTAPPNTSILSGQGTNSVVVSFTPPVEFGPEFTSGPLTVRGMNCNGSSITARSLALTTATLTPKAITGPSNNVCPGSTQTYSIGSVANASTYIWSVPAGAVINSGQGSTSISVTFPATFTSGAVTVKSGTTCFSSTARSLSVYSVPAIPASITGPVNGVCAGSTQTYTCPVSTTGASGYTWSVPAGAVINSGQGSNSISVTFPATFTSGTVSVKADNTCGSSGNRAITIRSVPAQPGLIRGNNYFLEDDSVYKFEIDAVAGAISYNWTAFGCTITGNGSKSISLTIPAGFNGTSLSVAAVNSCGESVRRELALFPNVELVSPQSGVFTPGQAIEVQYTKAVAKKSRLRAQLRILPATGTLHPDSGWLYISGSNLSAAVSGKFSAVIPIGLTGPPGNENLFGIQYRVEAVIPLGTDTLAVNNSRTSSGNTSVDGSTSNPCKPAMNQNTTASAWLSSVRVNNSAAYTNPLQPSAAFSYVDLSDLVIGISRNSTSDAFPASIPVSFNASGTISRDRIRVGVWFDANGDKVFSTAEFIGSYALAASPSTSALSISIPSTRYSSLSNGSSRMLRIRLVGNTTTAITGAQACETIFAGSGTTTNIGETQDYLLRFGSTTSTGREAVAIQEGGDNAFRDFSLQVSPNPVQAGSLLHVLTEEGYAAGEKLLSTLFLRDVSGKVRPLQPDHGQLRIPSACAPGIYFLCAEGLKRPLRISVW